MQKVEEKTTLSQKLRRKIKKIPEPQKVLEMIPNKLQHPNEVILTKV